MSKDDLEILYEDNHVIVVYKPANILSQGDATGDKDLLTVIKEYIKVKEHKPGNVYIGLVHRLDRPVEGIMVFAKSSKAAARLSNQIKKNEFQKHYLAVINGYLTEKKGVFKDYLFKDNNGNTTVTNSKTGKESILEYEVLSEKDNLSLVRIHLVTGRHHQIRVQFASRGYPLVGDGRYGNYDGRQIHLCSYQLSFIHPTTKEILSFERMPEKDDIWDIFL